MSLLSCVVPRDRVERPTPANRCVALHHLDWSWSRESNPNSASPEMLTILSAPRWWVARGYEPQIHQTQAQHLTCTTQVSYVTIAGSLRASGYSAQSRRAITPGSNATAVTVFP
jgi:hypothetical protein